MTPERLEEITTFIERSTGTNPAFPEICSMLRELEGGFGDQQQLETQDELIDQQRCRIGDLEDECQVLRDECERLKARQVPNLDALSELQADETNEVFKRLAEYCRCRVILIAPLPVTREFLNGTKTRLESIYAALPPWAKFRERE